MKKKYTSPLFEQMKFLAYADICEESVGDPTYGTEGDFDFGDLKPDPDGDDI